MSIPQGGHEHQSTKDNTRRYPAQIDAVDSQTDKFKPR